MSIERRLQSPHIEERIAENQNAKDDVEPTTIKREIFGHKVSFSLNQEQAERLQRVVEEKKTGIAIALGLGLTALATVLLVKKARETQQAKQETETRASILTSIDLNAQQLADFASFFQDFWTPALNYIRGRVQNPTNPAIAVDLTAFVFTNFFVAWPRYSRLAGEEQKALLYAALGNRIRNWYRDTGRTPTILSLEELTEHNWAPQQDSLRPTEDEALALFDEEEPTPTQCVFLKAVEQLDPLNGPLLLFKLTGGLTNKDIGSILDLTEGMVKSRYRRIMAEQLPRALGLG